MGPTHTAHFRMAGGGGALSILLFKAPISVSENE